ncbi:MAG TPA: hypothetical protein VJP05_03285, partial [Acidimicrobiia bacterium]|nr:hypothetical protein [Acidimicrobiia bacterium]
MPTTIVIPRIPPNSLTALLVGVIGSAVAASAGAPTSIVAATGILISPIPVFGARARANLQIARS